MWKDIKGYVGIYQVNEKGEIKSVERVVNHWRGGKKLIKERIRKAYLNKSHGYMLINLTKYSKPKTFLVHRIVAMAFIPNPENKPCINHINAVRTDNRVTNLEWCTYKENIYDAIERGALTVRGEGNATSKLTEKNVIEIRSSKNKSLKYFAEKFNVTRKTICDVIKCRTWKYLKQES